jgi:glycosyltransferase involved in cell wall biosynthesis
MRFHVISLPHTQTTLDFTACAFTEKVRKFAVMMKSLGHTVYVYSGDKNEAPCDEHVQCFTEKERLGACNGGHYTMASFDDSKPHWVRFNTRVVAELANRLEQQDFICVIGGYSHKYIADAYPSHMTVEFGIGYPGTFAKYRVFESYAWMHTVYGAQSNGNSASADGRFFDAVVPAYIEPELFPFVETPDDYYLFMGRLIERKGYEIAVEACKRTNSRLLIAGQGAPPSYGEYVGVVGKEKRAELFGNAIASFAPTIYIEPFGTVVIESQACGTPTLTTDWGAFTETVTNGFNGFRCRMLKDFIEAMEKAKSLDRRKIHEHAIATYGLPAIALRYDDYFKRLLTLWDDGWYTSI